MARQFTYPASLLAWLLASSLACGQLRNQTPELIKVTERVSCATGYALGNVICIRTDKSLVIVDTTESPAAAREILQALRKISPLPVSHIIYTHHHGDHINGAKVFKGPATKIIAQNNFVPEFAKYRLLIEHNRRVNATQFAATLPAAERGISLAADRYGKPPQAQEVGYLAPDILFDEKYSFEEGGVRFDLAHTRGETLDHLMVWLPGEQVLLPGDLFYPSFPMLSSPMKPERPVSEWAESLERMRKLQPAYLVGSHGTPVTGRAAIDATLANYIKAIRHVHDETIKRINQGLTLEEIRRQVRLPEDLAKLPYLAPLYGRVDWAVNGIYRQYTGWYDLNPANLNPGRKQSFHRALLEASGGPEALVKKARHALEGGRHQLVLDLTDVILDVEAGHRAAHALRAEALEKLGEAAQNGVERNIYRAAAQEHKKKAAEK
jgi:alkyl sulfatase BDS1-like metallo-beta-lactamase superfamily hydrolase